MEEWVPAILGQEWAARFRDDKQRGCAVDEKN